ncbi:acyl-CoA dehydrogenase family protein [Arthrobacter sp. zg-ZUI100]|uniref:Acyl-CoA dehydrogenase family protein n=1 Tax=Arthrobacter jiangjiafuii TaxID=2817475 RepID=A0A975R0V5_9MICC|nr:acyl-CoA dehydrogenase family protein [Arthrobacter jiangjiafuii]MBP3035396.1 acyl-CoA dehydrogenase family protein [Arthrobacter jiangjiafuii]MBP3042404.1 acyl-CoA dehydrogenase family protein [Arthrobacter jiangjiafuii]QWC09846.1 acyl-CoA dehydrogenase family protein [Arthrobacter jiangjiafuii]
MTDTIPQPPAELSQGLPPGPPPERSSPLDAPASRYLTAEGKRLAAGVRTLQHRIRELAPESERRGRLSTEIVEAFTELGLYRACAPIEYGGYALGARDIAEIARALGRGDAAASWTFFVGTSLRMVSTFPKPLVDELYSRQQGHVGPLAAGGSTFAAVTGKATRVEGGWNVEGKWTYVSGNHDAAWLFGGAAWVDGNRSGHALFMMDPADIQPLDDWHVAGMMASDSNSIITTTPMFVPDHRFIDMAELPVHMDSAAGRFAGLAYEAKTRASMMTATVLNMATLAGMAEGALEVFQQLAPKRKPFSPPYDTIAEMASSQVAAGKAKALIGVASATVLQYADEIDHLAVRGEDYTGDEEAQGCTDLAFAGQLAKDAIDLLLRILGSSGMALSSPLQRYSRDAGVILSHGAMRLESLAEISGRRLLGQPPFKMFAGGLQDKSAQK